MKIPVDCVPRGIVFVNLDNDTVDLGWECYEVGVAQTLLPEFSVGYLLSQSIAKYNVCCCCCCSCQGKMEKRVSYHMPDRPTSKLRQKLLEFGAALNVSYGQTGRHCSTTWRKNLNKVVEAASLSVSSLLLHNFYSFFYRQLMFLLPSLYERSIWLSQIVNICSQYIILLRRRVCVCHGR